METAVAENILDKVNALVESAPGYDVSAAEAPEELSEEEKLFTESIDDFSTEPVVFEEAAARLLNKVEELFDLSTKYDRHVPQYLECCGWLERGIKALASAALTKVVLEKYKYEFTLLDQLSTQKLCGMASFNFRKIDDALAAAITEKRNTAYKLLDMEYRWYHLLERLKATEEKIYRILCCDISDGEIFRRALMFSERSLNKDYEKWNVKPSVFRKATSFPIIQSTVREAVWEFHKKKEEEPVISHLKPNGILMTRAEYEEAVRAHEAEQKKQAEEAAKRKTEALIAETTQKMLAAAGVNDPGDVSAKSMKGSDPAQARDLSPDFCGKISAADKWNAIFAMQGTGKNPPGR